MQQLFGLHCRSHTCRGMGRATLGPLSSITVKQECHMRQTWAVLRRGCRQMPITLVSSKRRLLSKRLVEEIGSCTNCVRVGGVGGREQTGNHKESSSGLLTCCLLFLNPLLQCHNFFWEWDMLGLGWNRCIVGLPMFSWPSDAIWTYRRSKPSRSRHLAQRTFVDTCSTALDCRFWQF